MVKIVKAIDEYSTGDEGDIYFNPVIFEFAKERKIPLTEVLRVLQGAEGIEIDGFYWGRSSLINEIFDDWYLFTDSNEYRGVGNITDITKIFRKLENMDEKTIKQPLDTKKLGLGNWAFNTFLDDEISSFSFIDAADSRRWRIQGLIFGYAKKLEENRKFINWNQLPWGEK